MRSSFEKRSSHSLDGDTKEVEQETEQQILKQQPPSKMPPSNASGSSVTYNQKIAVLVLLVAQNSAVVLMTRYSRGILQENYASSSVVLVTEFVKFFVALSFVAAGSASSWLNTQPMSIQEKLVWLIRNSGYSWIPAVSYFFQNSLQYTALENLPSSVYAVLQQMKILSAAVCAYFMLNKKLSMRKWRALSLLVAGGILVESHAFEVNSSGKGKANTNPVMGTIAMLSIVGLSGFAGNITQKLLQNKGNTESTQSKELSIWDRNVQLAFWSVIVGSVKVLMDYSWMVENGGFFGGWTGNTLLLIVLWVLGGFLVAMTIKYTDVIIKGFASALSMVIISILGSLFLNDSLGMIFSVGAFVVVIAIFNYNEPEPSPAIKASGSDVSSVVVESNREIELNDETEQLIDKNGGNSTSVNAHRGSGNSRDD